jgi:hypothetical protein
MNRVARSPVERSDSKVQSLVAEYIQEKQRPAQAESKKTRRVIDRRAVTVILGIVCLASWVAPYPTQSLSRPVDARVERASARVALFLAAQAVVHFRVDAGRLPRTMSEAGIDGSAVKYFPGRDGSFVLQFIVRNHTLSYDSNLPATSILRNAEEIIAETGHG